MTEHVDVMVVGASVASAAMIERLHHEGFDGRIRVIDADPDAPYDRPPLSKDFLSGDTTDPGAPWWDDAWQVAEERAIGIDVAASTVRTVDAAGVERLVSARHIVIATGASPVRLPGLPDGVLHFRSAADARALRELMGDSGRRHFTVLGAGTIGSELASSLTAGGHQVTLIDRAEMPLERFGAGHIGPMAAAWMREAGVELRLGAAIESVTQRADGGWAIITSNGVVDCDVVVSAVGVRPAVEWLADSGIDIDNGVRCDEEGRARSTTGSFSDSISAIGDVAAWRGSDGCFTRREDWTSAQRQGRRVADRILGRTPEGPDADYFWTHQFGRRIQMVGTPRTDAVLTAHTDVPERRAAFLTLDIDGETVASIAINSPREFAMAMRRINAATV